MNAAPPAPVDNNEVGLGDVLLAMDLVDTLRHEQRVVSEALGAEAREQALIERVRRAYAAQGIAVSDALIAEGVARLKEQQFEYTPPPPGLATALAKVWVRRARIGTGLAAVGILAGILGGGWYGFVELPAQRRLATLVAETDAGIADANRELALLEERRSALAARIAAERRATTPPEAASAVAAELDAADAEVAAAATTLTAAASLSQSTRSDDPDDAGIAESRSERLARQRALITNANGSLARADRSLSGLGALRTLPGTIKDLRDEALAVAATDDARARVTATASLALSALGRGEPDTARESTEALRDMLASLQRALTVRIVSRPGVLSGVIRAPNDNPRASNYYLVVEAIDADGKPVPVPVTSEEDGTTKTVALWGVRVDARTFDRVRRDKSDDGIIQDDAAGTKARGHLEIEWTLPRAGGFIHTWERPR